MLTSRYLRTALAYLLYLAAVIAPNWLITHFGVVDVAPGSAVLMAPAAVYAVGFALVARDILHEAARPHGTIVCLTAIALGTIVSALIASPRLALASAAAFVLSEVLDLLVYLRLRSRGWVAAALASSYLGAVVDSAVFLALAPPLVPGLSNWSFFAGQWLGKAISITVVVAVAAALGVAARRTRTAMA